MDYQNIFTDYVRNFCATIAFFRGLSKPKDLKAADIQTTKAGAQSIADLWMSLNGTMVVNLPFALAPGPKLPMDINGAYPLRTSRSELNVEIHSKNRIDSRI